MQHSLITCPTGRLVLNSINLANVCTLLLDELHEATGSKGLLLNHIVAAILLGIDASRWVLSGCDGNKGRGR